MYNRIIQSFSCLTNSHILFFVLLIVSANVLRAQDEVPLEGKWTGKLSVGGIKLLLVFNVSKDDSNGYTATMDSPDQNAFGIPVSSVTINGDKVLFEVESISGIYKGVFDTDSAAITGNWIQGGGNYPVRLTKIGKVEVPNRPQNPKEPFPYKSERVNFRNEVDSITLAGTLTYPDKDSIRAVAVLISGSGPQDRDETILRHKPFLVLSDYLTRNGIACLRVDDRGVGESEGDFSTATTFDFVTDVRAAVNYLRTRNELANVKIGLIGHSEGGLIAPLVAGNDPDIFFIVLMAAPGVRGDSLLLLQQRAIGKASGFTEDRINENESVNRKIFNLILNNDNDEIIKPQIKHILSGYLKWMMEENYIDDESDYNYINGQLEILLSPWFKTFLRYNPEPALEKLKCYVLAINGEKDVQVPPEENLHAIEQALLKGGNNKSLVKELKGLNHLFQTADTGLPSEYGTIEETISPDVLKLIGDWIKNITR